jgi:hypothetical protein
LHKRALSNSELAALFYDRLKEIPGCPVRVTLAVTPSKTYGWTALMSPAERAQHPMFAKRFDDLLTNMRTKYKLAGD